MNPAVRIGKLVKKWHVAGQWTAEKGLYASGVAQKWQQAIYSLKRIKALDIQSLTAYSTAATSTEENSEEVLDMDAKIRYYCDALWTSLYSTLDILAQLVNVNVGSPLSEDKTDFPALMNHLDQRPLGTELQQRLISLRNSIAYGDLYDLRRCAPHRRPVYIEAQNIKGTPGYNDMTTTDTKAISKIRRLICDNPLSLNPSMREQRELVPFCERVVNQVTEKLDRVLMKL